MSAAIHKQDQSEVKTQVKIPFILSLQTFFMRQTYPKVLVALLAGVAEVNAQAGFATSEITSPIQRLVTIANACIAGLAILAVIYYAIKWIGGDEGAAKRIIGVIVVAVIALGAANFLGFITGKAEFDTFAK